MIKEANYERLLGGKNLKKKVIKKNNFCFNGSESDSHTAGRTLFSGATFVNTMIFPLRSMKVSIYWGAVSPNSMSA